LPNRGISSPLENVPALPLAGGRRLFTCGTSASANSRNVKAMAKIVIRKGSNRQGNPEPVYLNSDSMMRKTRCTATCKAGHILSLNCPKGLFPAGETEVPDRLFLRHAASMQHGQWVSGRPLERPGDRFSQAGPQLLRLGCWLLPAGARPGQSAGPRSRHRRHRKLCRPARPFCGPLQ
jgi:hypothetical protein